MIREIKRSNEADIEDMRGEYQKVAEENRYIKENYEKLKRNFIKE